MNTSTSGDGRRSSPHQLRVREHRPDGKCFEANLAGQGDAFADYQKSFDAAATVGGVADTFNQPLKGNFNQLQASSRRSTRT